MPAERERLEVNSGAKRAVFVRTADGWRPDWFYLGDRRMLRFKDHEWLSIGHVHPTSAEEAEELPDGGVTFRGTDDYGTVPVEWTVTVRPDESGGFAVECAFSPRESLELLEAYSAFEIPYEYDGSEHVTAVIGQNPVVKWEGAQRVSPPVWRHPAWSYSRDQIARNTAPCNAPLLCHVLSNADGSNPRCTTIIGDWNVCGVRDVYVTPTRTVDVSRGEWGALSQGKLHGYKFLVGALNWSSAFAKDPNVLYAGGQAHCQRVILDFSDRVPGGALDAMLLRAWERAAALDMPTDGLVEAYERAGARGVTWQAAVKWLRDVFCGQGAEGLLRPDEGIVTYALGARPKAGGDYGWTWWPQWAGPLHYRAMVTGDDELAAACDRYDERFAEHARKFHYHDHSIALGVSVLPGFWWARGCGRGGVLATALEKSARASLEASEGENGKVRTMDCGAQAATAEGFLLASQAYGDEAFAQQARVLLEEINAKLDGAFWEFNCGETGNLMHGGQIRPFGHGHAALANVLASRVFGEEQYRDAARRFARYLVAINYVTHNSSQDPDFDWRGWANGSIAGRDQIAEFPPWETIASLLCITPLTDEPGLESAFHDVLWYIARTGLAQFPAARTLKRILDESYQVRYVPRDSLASERDFYDVLPYLAYENPHDQDLLASYQGTDCLLGELVFGGGLARAQDGRLGVLAPRAFLMDPDELSSRRVTVWNPTPEGIQTVVTVTWPDGTTAQEGVDVGPRQTARIALVKAD